MELILFGFFIVGLFILIFLGLSMGMAWILNHGAIINLDTIKANFKECKIWIRNRDNQKKILVFVFGLLLWILGTTLTALWGMALITPYCKQSKVSFLISMPTIYIILVPSMYYIHKKCLGKKLALLTVLYFVSCMHIHSGQIC